MGIPCPNPVVSQMSVEVFIPQMCGTINLVVYDLNGRQIAKLNSESTPGSHVYIWNLKSNSGEYISIGQYFIKLSTEDISVTRKILVLN